MKRDAGPQGPGEKSAEAESGSQGTASKETGSPVLTATGLILPNPSCLTWLGPS